MSRSTYGTLGLLTTIGILLAIVIGCLEALWQLTCDQWTGELGKRSKTAALTDRRVADDGPVSWARMFEDPDA